MRQPYENKALPPCSESTRAALERARRLVDPAHIRDFDSEDGERKREQAKADAARLTNLLQRQQSTGLKSPGDDASS